MDFLIVDDDFGSRTGMARTLGDLYPDVKLHEAGSLREAVAKLEQTRSMRLVLLDLNLEDSRGTDTLRGLKEWCEREDCNPRLVVVSAAGDYDEKIIVKAIDNCATGFIPKGTSLEVFRSAIDLTLAGSIFIPERYLRAKRPKKLNSESEEEPRFTEREKQVASLLVQGLSYKQIAKQLEQDEPGRVMSDNTVRVHVQRMAWKLKVAVEPHGEGLSAKAAVLTALADRKLRF